MSANVLTTASILGAFCVETAGRGGPQLDPHTAPFGLRPNSRIARQIGLNAEPIDVGPGVMFGPVSWKPTIWHSELVPSRKLVCKREVRR